MGAGPRDGGVSTDLLGWTRQRLPLYGLAAAFCARRRPAISESESHVEPRTLVPGTCTAALGSQGVYR